MVRMPTGAEMPIIRIFMPKNRRYIHEPTAPGEQPQNLAWWFSNWFLLVTLIIVPPFIPLILLFSSPWSFRIKLYKLVGILMIISSIMASIYPFTIDSYYWPVYQVAALFTFFIGFSLFYADAVERAAYAAKKKRFEKRVTAKSST
jgi:hypothetical protein